MGLGHCPLSCFGLCNFLDNTFKTWSNSCQYTNLNVQTVEKSLKNLFSTVMNALPVRSVNLPKQKNSFLPASSKTAELQTQEIWAPLPHLRHHPVAAVRDVPAGIALPAADSVTNFKIKRRHNEKNNHRDPWQ